MGLLSIFQRKSGERGRPAGPHAASGAVQEARLRARRRLIGAAVLVVIGVIGFPLLFETQPRPIPVDIPIDIPRKDSAPALVMPSVRPAKPVMVAPVEPTAASSSVAASAPLITESQADAGRELPVPLPKAEPPAAAPVAKALPAPAKPTLADTPPHRAAPPVPPADAKRAQAALDGQPADKEAAKKDSGRFVVQVGAFAESSAAREMRQKVEKLGLKTYTQMTQTSSGSRIRVRVGPFASRDEAEKAQAKIKATGTPAVVLTL